jgi:hypothetical protein
MGGMKTRVVWLLTVPVLLASETLGHMALTRSFDAGGPRHLLLDSGLAPAALALLVVAAALALAGRALAAFREPGPQPLPSWRLAAVPSLAFLVQEHLERLAHDGEIGSLTAAEPVVFAGMLLQLPCGFLAVWLVRALLRVADRVGHALARRTSAGGGHPPAQPRPCRQVVPLRLPILASLHAGRAPPSCA